MRCEILVRVYLGQILVCWQQHDSSPRGLRTYYWYDQRPETILSFISFILCFPLFCSLVSWKTYSSMKRLTKNQFIWNVLESWVSPFYKFYDLNPHQDLDRAQLLFIYCARYLVFELKWQFHNISSSDVKLQ